MKKLTDLFKSFGYAFRGIADCINSERNMRIHLVCAIYMYSFLGLTDWFVLTRGEWAAIFLANAIVFMGELVNTAVESVVDLVTHEKQELARRAKDVAAGAVLIGAFFAVLTGIAILFQPDAFRQLFAYFSSHPAMIAAFVISFALATLFMFYGIPVNKKQDDAENDSENPHSNSK